MSYKRDASVVTYRNDYRTRYINYYTNTRNTVSAIVNIVGGSGGANEASEVIYLKIGSTLVSNEELQVSAPVQPIPITTVSTLFYNPSIVPQSTIVTSNGIYMTDGTSLYSLPSATILPSPGPVRSFAVDPYGNLYIATPADIYQYTSNTFSSMNISGLSNILSFAVSSNFYILQEGSSVIYMAESNGNANPIAGSTPGFSDGSPGKLKFPQSLTVDPTGQSLYVADSGNSLIRIISTSPPYIVSTISGNSTAFLNPFLSDNVGNRDGNGVNGETLFNHPEGIAVSPNGLYIADTGNNCIRAMTFSGTVLTLAGQPGSDPVYDISPQGYEDGLPGSSRWNNPTSLFYYDSTLYITEPSNNSIRVVTPILGTYPII